MDCDTDELDSTIPDLNRSGLASIILCAELVFRYTAKAVLSAGVVGSCCHHYQPLSCNIQRWIQQASRFRVKYLAMLVHDDLAILLKYPQHFSTLSQVPWLGVDFHMNSSAYSVGISWNRHCKVDFG